MIQSMTGYGARDLEISPLGKLSVELRSSNHKFLESVFHFPVGFLSLEGRIKKEIEAKVRRGRITCVITISGGSQGRVLINKALLKNYIWQLTNIKKEFRIKDEISINALMHLPGVLSLGESGAPKTNIWPRLRLLVKQALDDLVKMRQKEGRAIYTFLKNRAEALEDSVGMIKSRFKKASQEKLGQIKTDEEQVSFLKDTDITEEVDRLSYHIRNFRNKLKKKVPIGKELDFIAQEMQREANTLGAKSFDMAISARAVQIKSHIEKIREQVQNIE